MNNEHLLTFVKALIDVNRLSVAGLLARRDCTTDQVAGELDLRPYDAQHHIDRLVEAGMLTVKASGTKPVYALDRKSFETLARSALARPATPIPDAIPGDDGKLLSGLLTRDGRLTHIPLGSKKLDAVLRYALTRFKTGRRYAEKEVNQLLSQINEDTATLRRCLVDSRMLEREPDGSAYWRSAE